MRPGELKERLRGVLSFAVTPFLENHDLDLDGLARNIAQMSQSGVDAIVVAGGVGEFYALTPEEYRHVIRIGVEAAEGRVPVLAGIGHSTRIACDLAAFAEEAGAAGIMVNPFYFAETEPQGHAEHYAALAKACSLGQIIFATRGFPYTPELLERLAEVESVVAVKDEVGDLKAFTASVDRLGDRLAWINGMAEPLLIPYVAAGATSFTTGLGNFAPEIPLAIYRAATEGDYEVVRRMVREWVSPIANLRAKRKGYHIAVIKEAMAMLGRPAGPCRLPLLPVAEADRAELRSLLEGLGVLA